MNLKNLQTLINKRTVGIMLPGKSIVELEKKIIDLKKYDICWASLGVYNMMEDFILSKINRTLDILYDSATVAKSKEKKYENIARYPRLIKFLSRRSYNIWITTTGIIKKSVYIYYPLVASTYRHKIVRVDEIVSRDLRPEFMDVPNSLTLLIASVLAGGAKKIIFFGLDGYDKDDPCPVNSYYHPELITTERKLALGHLTDTGINRDTESFKDRFPNILDNYRKWFKNDAPLYNCSPITAYKMIEKVSYNEIEKIL